MVDHFKKHLHATLIQTAPQIQDVYTIILNYAEFYKQEGAVYN
jgi:hypothetical protein